MVYKSVSQGLNGINYSLAYVGVLPSTPRNFVIHQRNPTASDYRNFYIGDVWLNNASSYPPPGTPPTAGDLWILVSVSGNVATWINFGGGGTGTIQFLKGNTGPAVPPDSGGIINVVGDGVAITTSGNAGTNTLTISAITPTQCGFLYIQSSGVSNVTGDGTIYSLGSSVILTQIFDIGSNVYAGSGSGTAAYFQAPATARYFLEISVQFTNLQTGVFNDSIATYNIVTPERTYTAQFSPLGMYTANAMVADSGSFAQGFYVNLTAGDQVTFTCMSDLSGTTHGTKNIGVGGSSSPVQTFISGFIVNPGGLGGGGGGGSGTVQFLAGNTGGNVGPTAGGVINVIGDGTINVSGNPVANTLTISAGTPESSTTTNNTATPIFTYTLAQNSAINISGSILGAKSDYSAAIGGSYNGTARRTTGSAILVGIPVINIERDSNTGNPGFDIIVTGNNIELTVTGETGYTYNWKTSVITVILP